MKSGTTTEQHLARRITGKTTPMGHTVAVATQEAFDGSREKAMRIASVENNPMNLRAS